MGRCLEHYLVSCRTRTSLDGYDVGGSERLLAVVAAEGGSAMLDAASQLSSHVLATLLRNTGDSIDSLDCAVRRWERPFSAAFTRSRVPALLRAANAQLRESWARDRTGKDPALPISGAVLTTFFGSVLIAYVGNMVAVHRIRAGRVERLTENQYVDVGMMLRAGQIEQLSEIQHVASLGHTDRPDVREREEPIEPGDLFVLSRYSRWDTALPDALRALAEAPSFDAALVNCFHAVHRASWPGTLLIGRCT